MDRYNAGGSQEELTRNIRAVSDILLKKSEEYIGNCYDDIYDILPNKFKYLSLSKKEDIIKTIMANIDHFADWYMQNYTVEQRNKIVFEIVFDKEEKIFREYSYFSAVYENIISDMCEKILENTVTVKDYINMFEHIMAISLLGESSFCHAIIDKINRDELGIVGILMKPCDKIKKDNTDESRAFFLMCYFYLSPMHEWFRSITNPDSNGDILTADKNLINWGMIHVYFDERYYKTIKVILSVNKYSQYIFNGMTEIMHYPIPIITRTNKIFTAHNSIIKNLISIMNNHVSTYLNECNINVDQYLALITEVYTSIMNKTDNDISDIINDIPTELIIIMMTFGIIGQDEHAKKSKECTDRWNFYNGRNDSTYISGYEKIYIYLRWGKYNKINDEDYFFANKIIKSLNMIVCDKDKNYSDEDKIYSDQDTQINNIVKLLNYYCSKLQIDQIYKYSQLFNLFRYHHYNLLEFKPAKMIIDKLYYTISPNNTIFVSSMCNHLVEFSNRVEFMNKYIELINFPPIAAILDSDYPELIYLTGYIANPSLIKKENRKLRKDYFKKIDTIRESICTYDAKTNPHPIGKYVYDDYLKWSSTGTLKYNIMIKTINYTIKDVIDLIRLMNTNDIDYDIYLASILYRSILSESSKNNTKIDISLLKCLNKEYKYLYFVISQYIYENGIAYQ